MHRLDTLSFQSVLRQVGTYQWVKRALQSPHRTPAHRPLRLTHPHRHLLAFREVQTVRVVRTKRTGTVRVVSADRAGRLDQVRSALVVGRADRADQVGPAGLAGLVGRVGSVDRETVYRRDTAPSIDAISHQPRYCIV